MVGGLGWYLLRRCTPGKKSEVDEVLWTGEGRLSFRRSVGTSVISEIVIGLGRLARPGGGTQAAGRGVRQPAGRTGRSCHRPSGGCWWRAAAGAGLAAVYNVPLGGALFTAEVLIGAMNLPVVLPALACSGVATLTGWLYLPDRRHLSRTSRPTRCTPRLLVWAVLAGPVLGVLAAGYIRLIGWVSHHRARGALVLVAPLVAFGVLALLALRYPQLYGNGKGMAHDAFLGIGSIGLLAALSVLKPLVTALCLSSGASGGLFTPVLSTGAVLGGLLGCAWNQLWPGSPIGAYAMIGAAAMIGAGMQAPLAALALVLELTHAGFSLMVAMLLATVLATAVSPVDRRLLDLLRPARPGTRGTGDGGRVTSLGVDGSPVGELSGGL